MGGDVGCEGQVLDALRDVLELHDGLGIEPRERHSGCVKHELGYRVIDPQAGLVI